MNGAQLRMARNAVRMTVRQVAEAAEVSANTVTRIESDKPANPATLSAIKRVLEAAGVEFIEENGGGPGVRLRKST